MQSFEVFGPSVDHLLDCSWEISYTDRFNGVIVFEHKLEEKKNIAFQITDTVLNRHYHLSTYSLNWEGSYTRKVLKKRGKIGQKITFLGLREGAMRMKNWDLERHIWDPYQISTLYLNLEGKKGRNRPFLRPNMEGRENFRIYPTNRSRRLIFGFDIQF